MYVFVEVVEAMPTVGAPPWRFLRSTGIVGASASVVGDSSERGSGNRKMKMCYLHPFQRHGVFEEASSRCASFAMVERDSKVNNKTGESGRLCFVLL